MTTPNLATCGHCGLTWDDSISTSYTPAPSGRCPFEYFHKASRKLRADEIPASFPVQPHGRRNVTTSDYYSRARFFRDHAGSSYTPGKETPEQGKWRGALALASAELRGERAGLSFSWEVDPDSDSSDWSDERPAWEQWVCDCIDTGGESLAGSLSGVDFGRDGSPHGDSYARVVQAELALQYFSERAR
jgi:hypothetical protein